MSDPFIGEIRMFAGTYAPLGWEFCNGQLLSISQYAALFSLLGTTYGGNGQTTFALPDLRGRVPLHPGTGPGLSPRMLGEHGGTENVTLAAAQMPAHNHTLAASNQNGTSDDPTGNVLAKVIDPNTGSGIATYGTTPNTSMSAQAISSAGGGQPHSNVQPFLGVNFIIALQGIYPPRS